MSTPDEKYGNDSVSAFLTPEFENPSYGSVTIEVRHSERQSSTVRISRAHAGVLLHDLIAVLTESKPKQPRPAVGQVWRNKTSSRLVCVSTVSSGWYDGITWEALTGRGPKSGRVMPHYWESRFEFVSAEVQS